MKLNKLNIKNYRNLDGLQITLSPLINFIVGENNVGKSNLLNALSKILIGGSFTVSDFNRVTESIEIEFSLNLSDSEIGLFEDLCDPEISNAINIIAVQENPEEYIQYFHRETQTPIKQNIIRSINMISYDSLRNPRNEIGFDKTKGAGVLLNFIINSYLKSQVDEKNYLNSSEVLIVKEYTQNLLKHLNVFSRFGIHSEVEEDTLNMLSKILTLKDNNNVPISETGYGVQFNLLIVLSILEKIINILRKNKVDEITELSSLLVFDEPEIHLHPYLQRTIIKDIQDMVLGKDNNFKTILKELFGLTDLSGQIMIATHSPDIIGDDYSQIIRLFNDSRSVKAISGMEINLSPQQNKHLTMQFPFIKNAVFSKCVIIVEGESEYGCFKDFGIKMGIDFDRNGIGLIKAGGAESVLPLMKLFTEFNIPCVGVLDYDKKVEKRILDAENLFFTETKCFDSEIVKSILENSTPVTLEKILVAYDSQGKDRGIQNQKLNNTIREFGFSIEEVTTPFRFSEVMLGNELFEVMYVAWFSINKGVLLGKTIGKLIEEQEIPPSYRAAINKAAELTIEAGLSDE